MKESVEPRHNRFVVIGNPTLDLVVSGQGLEEVRVGGSALYASKVLASLGASVVLVGAVGSDFPTNVLSKLQDSGVDLTHFFVKRGVSTTFRLEYNPRYVSGRKVTRIRRGPDIPTNVLPEVLAGADVVQAGEGMEPLLLSGLCDELESVYFGVDLHVARKYDGSGLLNIDSAQALRNAISKLHVVKGSFEEVRAVVGAGADLRSALLSLSAREALLATDGPRPGYLVAGGEVVEFHPFPVREKDATGAGDVFLACFLFARKALGRSAKDAVRFGAAAASFSVEVAGASGDYDTAALDARAREIRLKTISFADIRAQAGTMEKPLR